MSVWSYVNGIVTINKSSHISLKEVIKTFFNENYEEYIIGELVQYNKGTYWEYRFSVSYCLDAEGGLEIAKEFMNVLKKNCETLDVETTIRWLK